ncbi:MULTISPECIES: TlpA family protein disulfide reductase [unclassified Carboxylicivirga]|uniref:TlpA family protein disulfide reductase n=1 Tax=Carboxylicivirga TaxID=1628153 RepID=UPI003D330375
MKTIFKAALVCLISAICLFSCKEDTSNYAQITGTFNGEAKDKEIHLCKVEHGTTHTVSTSMLNEKGEFGFACPVDEPGLYVINVMWSSVQRPVRQEHNLKRFYLDKGVNIDIHLEEGSYQLVKSNCAKNKLLSEWNEIADSIFTYSHGFQYNLLSYEDFFPVLPEFVDQADKFKYLISTNDASFDELLGLMVDLDLKFAAVNFLFTPQQKHPSIDLYPDYYKQILNEKANDTERLLELANTREFMRTYSMYKVMNSGLNLSNAQQRLEAQLATVENELLKGYFAIDNIQRYKTYDDKYLNYKQLVSSYLSTPYLKEQAEAHEISIRNFKEGKLGFNFKAQDVNGKFHEFSDFKGTLVYIDLWATWCGPCKAEIPALQALEKKFHGQPVTFVSLSLDKAKDIEKWRSFVKDNSLTGVQLIADDDFDSPVATAYGINRIPRFMLFDKEGVIISADAPRPSDKGLESLLMKHLN